MPRIALHFAANPVRAILASGKIALLLFIASFGLTGAAAKGPVPGQFPEKIKQLNALMQDFAKKNGRIVICDTWSIFDDGQGVRKKEDFLDLLHPNKDGYAKWKAALEEVFAQWKL